MSRDTQEVSEEYLCDNHLQIHHTIGELISARGKRYQIAMEFILAPSHMEKQLQFVISYTKVR